MQRAGKDSDRLALRAVLNEEFLHEKRNTKKFM